MSKDAPVGWDGWVGGVRVAIEAVNVAEARSLLDDLTVRVGDFESKLLISHDGPADTESVGAQSDALLWESTETAEAIAAEVEARKRSNIGGSDGGGGSDGSGGSGGGDGCRCRGCGFVGLLFSCCGEVPLGLSSGDDCGSS